MDFFQLIRKGDVRADGRRAGSRYSATRFHPRAIHPAARLAHALPSQSVIRRAGARLAELGLVESNEDGPHLHRLIAAIAGGATTGLIKGLPEAYAALKGLVVKAFGADSTACQAIENLEAKPGSAGWKEDLAEDLAARNAAQNPDMAAAAAKIMEILKASEQGRAIIQTVTGNYNATAANGSTATVNVTRNR